MEKNVENWESSPVNGKVDGAATLKSSLAIPQKAINKVSIWATNATPRQIKENGNRYT